MKSPLGILLITFFINPTLLLSQEENWYYKNAPDKTQTMTVLEYCQFASNNGNGFPWIDCTSSFEEVKKAAYIYNTYNIYFPSGIFDKCLGNSYFEHEEYWCEVRSLLTNDSLYHFGEQNLLFVRKNKNENYQLYFYKITKPDPFSEEADLNRIKNERKNIDTIYIIAENILMKNPKEGDIAIISISLSPKNIFNGFKDISLDYMTVAETAIENVDYEAISGRILFNDDSPNKIIVLKIKILKDNINEGKETFSLKLSNPTNAILRTNFIQFTIQDEKK